IKYAQLLREKTLHSPAIVTFLEGIFRYTKGKLENNPKLLDEASALFEIVPTLRIRYLGKTMTLEKAVIVQSQRYFKVGKTMILPVLVSGLLYPSLQPIIFQNESSRNRCTTSTTSICLMA